MFSGVLTIAASISLYNGVLRAAEHLHVGILFNILRSPMSFFDTTPVGRVLNRFGKDVDVLDNVLAFIIRGVIMCFLGVASVPIIIGMSTPLFLTTLIPLGIFYMIVQVCSFSI